MIPKCLFDKIILLITVYLRLRWSERRYMQRIDNAKVTIFVRGLNDMVCAFAEIGWCTRLVVVDENCLLANLI